jgi:hypothetical protein
MQPLTTRKRGHMQSINHDLSASSTRPKIKICAGAAKPTRGGLMDLWIVELVG